MMLGGHCWLHNYICNGGKAIQLIEQQIENFSGIGSLGQPVTKTNRHSLLGDMYAQDYRQKPIDTLCWGTCTHKTIVHSQVSEDYLGYARVAHHWNLPNSASLLPTNAASVWLPLPAWCWTLENVVACSRDNVWSLVALSTTYSTRAFRVSSSSSSTCWESMSIPDRRPTSALDIVFWDILGSCSSSRYKVTV